MSPLPLSGFCTKNLIEYRCFMDMPFTNREVNLHTHTYLCKHACGTVEDYCAAAVREGMKVLGISDHSPLPEHRSPESRMDMEQLDEYTAMFTTAREKYPELTLLSGFETDVDFDMPREFFTDYLLKKYHFDYLALGVHFIRDTDMSILTLADRDRFHPDTYRRFVDRTVTLMEWGIFDFVTHPDAMLMNMDHWDSFIEKELSRIPAAAERTGIPLEINAYGLRKPKKQYADGIRCQYPVERFWEMASNYRISCVIGSDAHRPDDVFGNSEEAYAIAEKFNIPCANAEVAQKILRRRASK